MFAIYFLCFQGNLFWPNNRALGHQRTFELLTVWINVQARDTCLADAHSAEIVSNEELENTRRKQRTALERHSQTL